MKKRILLLGFMVLMFVLTLGVSSVWAETYSTDLTDGLSTSAFTASSIYGNDAQSYGPQRAFDNVWDEGGTTGGFWTYWGYFTNEWLQVDFGTAKAIAKVNYQVHGQDNYIYGINNFKIQASNDASTWVVCLASRKCNKRQKINAAPGMELLSNLGMLQSVALAAKYQ